MAAAGACTACPKRTGANTALFDDFAEDDRCMDAACFKAKVDAHIAREKEKSAGLIQITRAYYTNNKGEEKVLTRNEYTFIEPEKARRSRRRRGKQPQCSKATNASWSKVPENAANSSMSVRTRTVKSMASRTSERSKRPLSGSAKRNGSGGGRASEAP